MCGQQCQSQSKLSHNPAIEEWLKKLFIILKSHIKI
jgi:hypothetical protein